MVVQDCALWKAQKHKPKKREHRKTSYKCKKSILLHTKTTFFVPFHKENKQNGAAMGSIDKKPENGHMH